jgi:hypothetical protein
MGPDRYRRVLYHRRRLEITATRENGASIRSLVRELSLYMRFPFVNGRAQYRRVRRFGVLWSREPNRWSRFSAGAHPRGDSVPDPQVTTTSIPACGSRNPPCRHGIRSFPGYARTSMRTRSRTRALRSRSGHVEHPRPYEMRAGPGLPVSALSMPGMRQAASPVRARELSDIRAQCDTAASTARVWSVLCDGWMYPVWVVGAARMRAVDENWPSVGSRLHHSVGLWPALLNDHTEVLSVVEEQELRLLARALPAGQAEVTVLLEPRGTGCHLEMSEVVAHPPFSWLPRHVHDTAVYPRNRESLLRLKFIAEQSTSIDG